MNQEIYLSIYLLCASNTQITQGFAHISFSRSAVNQSINQSINKQPAIKQATYFKRKDALEGVLNEQNRQRQLIGGEEARDPERLRHVSQLAAEWFLHRALEFGKQDAKVAREFCACSKANVDDGVSVGDVPCFDNDKNQEGVAILHGSFALMDIDSGNDNDNSTLRFWADSSWTRNLMEE